MVGGLMSKGLPLSSILEKDRRRANLRDIIDYWVFKQVVRIVDEVEPVLDPLRHSGVWYRDISNAT